MRNNKRRFKIMNKFEKFLLALGASGTIVYMGEKLVDLVTAIRMQIRIRKLNKIANRLLEIKQEIENEEKVESK